MTQLRRRTVAASLLAATLAFSACGGTTDEGQPLGSPSTSADDEAAGDHDDPADAATWLGLSRSEAEALAADAGWELRVAREDDMVFPLDDDRASGRVTVEYDYRGADEPIVTVATVVADDGTTSHAEADDTGPDNMVDDGSATGPGDEPADPQGPAVSGPADSSDEPDDDTHQMSPQEVAEGYLGLTEDEARLMASQQDRELRIGRRGDEQYMLTEDYRIGRITVELDDVDGDWTVVEVVLEAEDGPVVASEQ